MPTVPFTRRQFVSAIAAGTVAAALPAARAADAPQPSWRNYSKLTVIDALGGPGNANKPDKPLVFLKLPLSSVPPGGPVKKPAVVTELDYEAELLFVMGPDNTIAGYAVADDVSARDLQNTEAQWTRAKGFDSSCPWGPWITTDINGERRQDARTSDLIFKPDELIEFIAQTCTLEPGAIVLTGTPDGVGAAMNPPRFLQPGDQIRIEIEGLGTLEHPVT